MSSRGRVPLEAALVRVWKGDTPVGAGFLAGPREVLTAAHVVAAALGVTATEPRTDGTFQVTVDFVTNRCAPPDERPKISKSAFPMASELREPASDEAVA